MFSQANLTRVPAMSNMIISTPSKIMVIDVAAHIGQMKIFGISRASVLGRGAKNAHSPVREGWAQRDLTNWSLDLHAEVPVTPERQCSKFDRKVIEMVLCPRRGGVAKFARLRKLDEASSY
ncbi:hypothetical protein HBH53_042040 [Parastagonospora nodorum]|nr:hypothetical protein HBH53_042040 [Parastagonospora nodorum]KAH3979895.1 hypothetical protein HBH51_053070 [Parastagonospora nodorum]KAH4369340.1 hypothetical protein HBH97_147460 [Parastagonospora nodorum]KAH4963964.1 hypothetical protein HBI78_111930 [Parastagonospora nodorum]KAH5065967.1 hypothetical protein HBI73_199190 [Parastagonospora nodorum]